MKLCLICPSNMMYMPYVNNYIKILDDMNVDYKIINWDRFHIETSNINVYKDNKVGFRRGYLDYCKYKKFIIEKLEVDRYDKLIVFGIQLTFFLKEYLLSNYSQRYIIDIRDYNKIVNFFNINNIIKNSEYTVISSLGFKEWLPKGDKYVLSHNSNIENIDEIDNNHRLLNNKLNISYIGSIRDLKINIRFIKAIHQNTNININYHGKMANSNMLCKYVVDNGIKNVFFTKEYNPNDEEKLYKNSSFINIIIPDKGINNKTLMPNRLYNAVRYGIPIITTKGTYLSKQVQKYKLGMIINRFENVNEDIINYLNNESKYYNEGRISFLNNVISDNKRFRDLLKRFCAINEFNNTR